MGSKSPDVMNFQISLEGDEIEIVASDIKSETSVEPPRLVQETEDEFIITEIEASEIRADELPEDARTVNFDNIHNHQILEHVCKKCNNSFSNFLKLKTHLAICRKRKKPTMTEDQLTEIEERFQKYITDNICFCCEEDVESAHAGHIRCGVCPKSFKNDASFERHSLLLHSDCTDFPCDVCNTKCPSERILKLHKESHAFGKQFACQKCGKEFTRKYHLVRHLKFSGCDSLTDKKEFACKVCGKGFYRVDNLRSHLRTHLGFEPKSRDYKCPFCDKKFFGMATLNIHIRTHTGERPFQCDLCEKAFPSNPALVKHRRSHTGEKPYICSLCTRGFAAKEVLNRHMKTHTGDRPHKCEICSKSFIQATQLKSHMRHHSGKTFECEECVNEFPTKARLMKHIKMAHTPQNKEEKQPKRTKKVTEETKLILPVGKDGKTKILVCGICGKEFASLATLRNHTTKSHSRTKPRKCEECDEIIENQAKMVIHMKWKHNEIYKKQKKAAKKKQIEIVEENTTDDEDVVNIVIEEDNGNVIDVKIESEVIPEEPQKSETNIENTELLLEELPSPPPQPSANKPDRKRKSKEMLQEILEENSEQMEKKITPKDALKTRRMTRSTGKIPEQTAKSSKHSTRNQKISKKASKEEDTESIIFMDDDNLKDKVGKLLNLLLEESILTEFGWPESPVENVLSDVIKQCGHEPADYKSCSDLTTKIRENVKLLLTVVVDNDSIKTLLNNHTIDEVIIQVLKMADTP